MFVCHCLGISSGECALPTLYIHLLGDFRLLNDDTVVRNVVQTRHQALLTYLLLHRQSPQPRQQVAFLFWPETTEHQARTNLRQILHNLRRAWPEADQFLQIETKTLQWRVDSDYRLDVADFESDLSQATKAAGEGHSAQERIALDSAVKHYGGDLLSGCYDEWIFPERERLRQAYFGALERLILLTEEQRNYRSAINYAERLLRDDPLHETTFRRLMRLHALQGDRTSALRVYHACVTILERELGVEPHEDTQEAYQRLLNMEAPAVLGTQPPLAAATRALLVGRRDAWNRLRGVWRRVTTGNSEFVLISGEAGTGKTRLAEEFLGWVARQGITTTRTRAYAAEGQLAYGPLTQLLRTDPLYTRLSRLDDVWLTELARILPEVVEERPDLPKAETITDPWQRQRLFEALARAVLNVRGPLVLLLDDLQWYDQDSLEWLHYLLHFDTQTGFLILGAMRPEEVDQNDPLTTLVLNLRSGGQLTEIDLEPLDSGDTAALAEQMAGKKLATDQIIWLYRYTEGNPLFVVETIRAKESAGDVAWGSAGMAADQDPVFPSPVVFKPPDPATGMPPKVQAMVQYRLQQLSPAARELASLAASIGREFKADVLVQASQSDEETLVQGLDELWRRRIVREQGGNAYDFSHDRIREVAYAEASAARRKMYHRRIATALEQIYAANPDEVSGQIAAHYERAGKAKQAITFYQRAAGVAQRTFSNAEVIGSLTRALALLPNLPDTLERAQTKLTLLIGLGTGLMASKGYGHPEVEQTLLRAWDLCRQLDAHEEIIPVLTALWICNNLKGDLAEQAIWAEQLERHVLDQSNVEYRTMIYFALAGTALYRGQFQAAQQYAEQGLSGLDPDQSGSQSSIYGVEPGIILTLGLALSLWLLGYPDQALEHAQHGLDLALQSAQPATIAATLGMGTVVQQWRGEVSLTLHKAEATIDYAMGKGMPQWVAHGRMLRGWALGHSGQVEVGIAELQEGLAAWQAMGAGLSLTYYSLLLAELLTISSQFEEGLQVVEEAARIIRDGGETWMEAELYRCKGELLLANGENVEKIEICFQQALEIARLQKARSFELRTATSLCRLRRDQGIRTEARDLLSDCFGWFSEGFDTADLRQAKMLLESFN